MAVTPANADSLLQISRLANLFLEKNNFNSAIKADLIFMNEKYEISTHDSVKKALSIILQKIPKKDNYAPISARSFRGDNPVEAPYSVQQKLTFEYLTNPNCYQDYAENLLLQEMA